MSLTTNSPEVRSFLKYIALLLLLLNGIGALVGGIPMIAYPDGSTSGISLDYLQYSPFSDYFIPGIILVIVIGFFSLLIFFALIFNVRHYSWLVKWQGAVLLSWIIIQMIMVREVNFLHFAFASIGIVLLMLGHYLQRFEFK